MSSSAAFLTPFFSSSMGILPSSVSFPVSDLELSAVGGEGEAPAGGKWFRYCGRRGSDTEAITIVRVDASRLTSSTK
jgi:hypothetical protein